MTGDLAVTNAGKIPRNQNLFSALYLWNDGMSMYSRPTAHHPNILLVKFAGSFKSQANTSKKAMLDGLVAEGEVSKRTQAHISCRT